MTLKTMTIDLNDNELGTLIEAIYASLDQCKMELNDPTQPDPDYIHKEMAKLEAILTRLERLSSV